MKDDAVSQAEPIAVIAEEFAEELRAGKSPTVEEFASRYPEHADDIRDLLPTLVVMEQAREIDASDAQVEASEAGPSMIGRQLGDYLIMREVGRGGMGVVYEAEQISLGRRVALKVLPESALATPNQRTRFEREAKAAGALHHSNIVPVFGVGMSDGISYFVMQFIQGLGLDEVLQELKRMRTQQGNEIPATERAATFVSEASLVQPSAQRIALAKNVNATGATLDTSTAAEQRAAKETTQAHNDTSTDNLVQDLFSGVTSQSSGWQSRDSSGSVSSRTDSYWRSVGNIGVQTASALHYAHEQGITHRDIKPGNLLLDLQGTIWITDFGLAKASDQQDITHTGDILGTLRYMPPEGFEGRSDARSDVYSLGVTLYELVTLRPAFQNSDRRQLMREIAEGSLQPIGKTVPKDLATIIQKACEREVGDRYQSAKMLAEDLQRFLRDEPILARRPTPYERLVRWSRRNRGLAASLAGIASLMMLMICVSSFAAWYYANQEEVQRGLYQQTADLSAQNEKLLDENRLALNRSNEARLELDSALTRVEHQEHQTRVNLYNASMLKAKAALNEHRGLARAQAILQEWRPQPGEEDLRGWEWYYINSVCNKHDFALKGHTDRVYSLSLHPDGRRLASGSRDGTVRIWDIETQQELKRYVAPFQQVHAVEWSADGEWLAAGGGGGPFGSKRGWFVLDGEEIVHSETTAATVFGVSWSGDKSKLAVLFKDGRSGRARGDVFDTSRWQRVYKSPGTRIGLYRGSIDFNRRGNLFAMPVEAGGVKPFENGPNVSYGLQIHEVGPSVMSSPFRPVFPIVLGQHRAFPQCVAFNQGAEGYIASGARDSKILIYSLMDVLDRSEEVRRRLGEDATAADMEYQKLPPQDVLTGHTHAIADLKWNPDHRRLASAAWDGTARVWDWHPLRKRRTEIVRFHCDPGHCFTIEWSADGETLITGGDSNEIKFWKMESGSPSPVYQSSTTYATSPNGEFIALRNINSGGLRIVTSNGVVHSLPQDKLPPELMAAKIVNAVFSPCGKRVAAIYGRGAASGKIGLAIWNLDSESPNYFPEIRNLEGVSFSRSGSRIAGRTRSGKLRIWDVESGELQIEIDSIPTTLDSQYKAQDFPWANPQWSPDDSNIAFVSKLGEIIVADTQTGDAWCFPDSRSGRRSIKWNPKGDKIVSTANSLVEVWSVDTKSIVLQNSNHFEPVMSVDWNGDGQRILSVGARGTLFVHDADTLAETMTFEMGVPCNRASWSPDGKKIFADLRGRLRIFDASKGYLPEEEILEVDTDLTEASKSSAEKEGSPTASVAN